jgi:hypothetical protein
MKWLKNLIHSQDARYFFKTAIKIAIVPIVTTGLIIYSLILYLGMNYSFFLANGFAEGPEMKEAFWDHFAGSLFELIPWAFGIYFGIFALGMVLAYLVLRPFFQVAQMCEDVLNGETPNTKLDPISAQKLVLRSAVFFMEYLDEREKHQSKSAFAVPSEIQKISSPRPDGVFYLQYACLITLVTGISGFAIYVGVTHLHEQIVQAAMAVLKANKTIGTFLISQQDSVENIAWACTAFTSFLYLVIARSIIREVEGVSYGYLRDIREILAGNHMKRITPRFNDPGKDAAFAINQIMNLIFIKKEQTTVLPVHTRQDAPPAFIEEFQDNTGQRIYRVVTSDGEIVEGLDFEDTVKLLKKVS